MTVITKRDYLISIYNEFQMEIKPLELNLDALFPPIAELNLPDLVMNFKSFFSEESKYETNVKMLMQVNNININEKQFVVLYPIIKQFLQKFTKIL